MNDAAKKGAHGRKSSSMARAKADDLRRIQAMSVRERMLAALALRRRFRAFQSLIHGD